MISLRSIPVQWRMISQRVLLATMAAALVLTTTACRRTIVEGAADPSTEVRIISQVLGTTTDPVYEVRWFPSGCESLDRVDIDESADEVALTVWAYVDSADCEVLTGETSTTVTLTEPLGDRVLLDGNLDTTIALNGDVQPPEDLEP